MVEENPNSDGNFFMLNPWHVVMKLIDYADPDAQVEQDQLIQMPHLDLHLQYRRQFDANSTGIGLILPQSTGKG